MRGEDLAFALDFAARAGRTVNELVAAGFEVATKADNSPVTTADQVLNDRFVEEVKARFPEDGVLGEEGGFAGVGRRVWVIDPVDGTQQLILGIPLFMVSIALVVDGSPVVAVAHNPSTGQTYRATLGGGAFLGERRLAVSGRDGVGEVATVNGGGSVPTVGGSTPTAFCSYGEAKLLGCIVFRGRRCSRGARSPRERGRRISTAGRRPGTARRRRCWSPRPAERSAIASGSSRGTTPRSTAACCPTAWCTSVWCRLGARSTCPGVTSAAMLECMVQRWVPPVLLLALAVLLAVRDSSPLGLLAAGVLLLSALLIAPTTGALLFPRSVSAAEARHVTAADGRPIVYWRPGCPFCLRLRATLIGRTGRAVWVNIWSDPQAAAAVRDVAGGNETVPTVVFGDRAHVNPDPRWVRRLTP